MYSVHIQGNGSTGFARDYLVLPNFAAVKRELQRFGHECWATPDHHGPGAWADVYPHDSGDSVFLCHGDYPLRRYVYGPRGGVSQELI